MRPLQHTTGVVPSSLPYGASYRGRGIWIEPLPDGWFVGLVEGGYRSRAYPDAQQALEDSTDWIDASEGGRK